MASDGTAGPLRVGEKFLKYTIQGLLGTGGHAWVYQGADPFLDVEVAIKILHRPGGVTSDMLRRGQAEAKLLYRLKHESIVSVLDAGITDGGLLYIVMELLRGQTLRRLLMRKRRLPLEDALPLFAKICDGVEAAHAFKAVHRDLKPENVFVLEGNQPKVLDFGIAKVVDAAGWTTEKDVIHGTVLYMSPEQLKGEKATARSDVYALGLILFEALHGRHPLLIKNQTPTVKELTWMQLSVRPPRLDELDPTIPRDLGKLIERMLLKIPDHRVATMQDCALAIRGCLARLSSQEREAESGRRTFVPITVTSPLYDTERVASPAQGDSVTNPRLAAPLASEKPRRSERLPNSAATVRPVTTGSSLAQRTPPVGAHERHRKCSKSPLGWEHGSGWSSAAGVTHASTVVDRDDSPVDQRVDQAIQLSVRNVVGKP